MAIRKILIVEDSPEYLLHLKSALQQDYIIFQADNILRAKEFVDNAIPDLIILDVGLGQESGFDLLVELKNSVHSAIPVLFLSARSSTTDKITGLSVGAEDYLVKPIDTIELKIRLKNIFSRIDSKKIESVVLEKAGIKIDLLKYKSFLITKDEFKELILTPTEFKILYMLLKNADIVLSREKLLDHIWGGKMNVTERTIDIHVHSLRKKLGLKSGQIQAVTGMGYRFSTQESINS